MKCHVNRRSFLKTTGTIGAGIGLAGLGGSRVLAAALAAGAPNAEKLGWRLGSQAWTFRLFPLFETIDKIASLGLHYIETGSGRALTKDRPDVTFGEDSPAAVRLEVKKKLADSGVKLVSHYTNGPFTKDIGQSRKVFEFAKDMGIETIVFEPDEDAFDTLEKLADEYGVNVAIHNHPKPSHYWNPDTVLKVCQGRGRRIGACADTGHWKRSGLNPVECLKKLEGRIIQFHFKDVSAEPDVHDVPWGTGVCDVKGMLTEVYRQKLKALFSVEYEYNWENSLPEIAQCVAYFDRVAVELAAWDLPPSDGPLKRR